VAVEAAARELSSAVGGMPFAGVHVYNPLEYAWDVHREYLRRYVSGPKRVLFLGMNPGPFGMVQTGVPFGEVAAVRDWLGLAGQVDSPRDAHPKRPVLGFACTRSEVSGRRLWGLFRERFGTAERFFAEHAVVNYCPLAFVEASGRNRIPEKLPADEREALFEACDKHLREVVAVLRPEWLIGVGTFAADRAERALARAGASVGRILHPSPASPAANRDWAGAATAQLVELRVWPDHPPGR
jgi:single-strand selective monofunctional uracil DNA glycosylase